MRVLLFVLVFINSLFGAIVLEDQFQKKSNFTLEKLYDATKKETIEEVSQKIFQQIPSQFTFGFKKGDIWFRLTIKNRTKSERFILHFTEPYYLQMDLYTQEDSSWSVVKNGLHQPLKQRDVLFHNPTFELHIKPDETKIFYIKANSKITTAGEFEIYEKEYFYSIYGNYNDILYMFYFGGIFIMTLLNLFVYFRLKDRVYLYYSGYTLFFLLWVASYSGLILYTPVDGYYYQFIMVTSLFIMFLILFSSEFLNVKKYIPKIYTPLNIFGYTFGVLAILIVISFDPWFEVMNALASVVFFVLLSVAIYILRKNNDINIKYYLFAISIYMVTVSLMSAMVNGWIQNSDINRYSFLYGSFFELLFFTLLLTNRFYIFQNEKIVIQNELIELKNKKEILQEKEIQKRTQEINIAFSQVKDLSHERELLLKEVYHRVKNNFHTIIALLHMEKKNPNSSQIDDTFLNVINRIRSMSLVHEFLYESQSLSSVNSKDYFKKIVDEIEKSYNKKSLTITSNIDSFLVTMDTAINLSMIINEILSNSIKHHSQDYKCLIDINILKQNQLITLTIEDNGEGFDIDKIKKGLGLKLVKQFSKRLKESKYFLANHGTKFELEFCIEANNEEIQL